MDSSSKINKNTEDSDSEDEGVEEGPNDFVLSVNIMFAYAENQVQAHKDFMKFAKLETQNYLSKINCLIIINNKILINYKLVSKN